MTRGICVFLKVGKLLNVTKMQDFKVVITDFFSSILVVWMIEIWMTAHYGAIASSYMFDREIQCLTD